MIINDDFLTSVLEQAHMPAFPRPSSEYDFYPSTTSAVDKNGGHHGACLRMMYYRRSGAPGDPIDLEGHMIMDSGTAIGDNLAKYFMNCGIAVNPSGTEGELRVLLQRTSPGGVPYRISGRIDVVCKGPQNQHIGYEFKTVWSSGKAGRVIKSWRGRPQPDPKNVMQTALYAYYARENLGIYDWRLTYIYIEGKIGRTYNITVDGDNQIFVDGDLQPYTIDDIFAQFDRLADSLKDGEPPAREGELFYSDEQVEMMAINGDLTKKQTEAYENGKPVLVSWSPCTYCDYIGTCWGEEEEKKAKEARK